MNSRQSWIGFGVLFLALMVYSSFLRQREDSLKLELEAHQLVQKGRRDMQASLKYDIERVEKLAVDIVAELHDEEANFKTLNETLENIQIKLNGAEELEKAVAELQKEFNDLLEVIKLTDPKNRLLPKGPVNEVSK